MEIKDIVPEPDWNEYVIQDEPTPPTPKNIVSSFFLNGMANAVKGLLTKVQDILDRLGLVSDYVIESGSNERGHWVKWNSGKLVQWGKDTKTVSPTSTASGIAYQNSIRVNYPMNFIGEPEYVGINIIRTVGLIWSDLFSKSNNGYCEGMVAGVSTNATGILTFYAIGRWK